MSVTEPNLTPHDEAANEAANLTTGRSSERSSERTHGTKQRVYVIYSVYMCGCMLGKIGGRSEPAWWTRAQLQAI